MYSAIFSSDNGEKYVFGENGNTVFDMDFGNGVAVDVRTSQGFAQIGETVQSRKVSSRRILVSGVVYGDVYERKTSMRKIFAPFSSGVLKFGNEYYIRVVISETPTFSPVKHDGRFVMQFLAAFPFFRRIKESVFSFGDVLPSFKFPINYSIPHNFGETIFERYVNVFNDGDVETYFNVTFQTNSTSVNPTISNLKTFKHLSINGTINVGDVVSIYRDDKNVLRAELFRDGETTDIISWIDEESTLFSLDVGDNLIAVNDDGGLENLFAKISFNPAVVAIYEH